MTVCLSGSGICGAIVAGAIVDKTKRFEEVAKFCFSMSTIGGAAFTVVSFFWILTVSSKIL